MTLNTMTMNNNCHSDPTMTVKPMTVKPTSNTDIKQPFF